MDKPEQHILLCGSFRVKGEAQGVCAKSVAGLAQYIEEEILDRGIEGTMVTMTGCLKVCDRGPAMVVYPGNIWYGGVDSEEAVDKILDALEEGSVAEEYVIT